MASVTVVNNEVQLQLTMSEKLAGLLRDLRVPLSSVTSVRVLADPFDGIRGLRAPGLSIPGRTRIGTWRGHGKTFAVARRDTPALQLELADEKYARIVVSLPDAEGAALRIRGAAGLQKHG